MMFGDQSITIKARQMRRVFKAGTGFGAAEKLETDLESYRFEPEAI